MRSVKSMRTAKIGSIIISASMLVLGVALMFFPGISAKALCCAVGVTMVLYGTIKIIGYFSKDLYRLAFQYDLAGGVLLAALGILMLVRTEIFVEAMIIILGVLIMSDGLFKIQIALDSKNFGVEKWWLIFVLAIMTAAAGLILIIKPSESASVVMMFAGAAIAIEGVLGIVTTIYAVKIVKNQRPDVITVEFEEKDD